MPKTNRRNIRQTPVRKIILSYLKHSHGVKQYMPLQIFLLIVDGVLQSLVPAVLAYVVSQLETNAADFARHKLPWVALASAVACVLFYFVAFWQHYLAAKISTVTAVNFQVNLYNHLQKLGADFYQRTHVGEVTRRMTGDVAQGVTPLYFTFNFIVWPLAVIIPACVAMALMNVKMFLVFLVTMLIFTFISRKVVPLLRSLQREVADEMGHLNAHITEDISVVSLVRAFSRQELVEQEIEKHCNLYLDKALKTAKVSYAFTDILNMFIALLAPLLVLLAGAYYVGEGISVAILVGFFGYWKTASGPIAALVGSIASLFASFSSFDRLQDFFDETPLIADRPNAKGMIFKGRIEFKEVTFRYPIVEGNIVIDHLSFVAAENTSLAIVGESGAGKSTIVQLIMRFYDPIEGQILIDQENINNIKQSCLRQQIGLVPQETILLSGSVRRNMQFAKPQAGDAEIIEALKNAQAWEFLEASHEGLDTVLGERGARLSGGQKQRLSIARVFLKNPPIVIFDEATSALDTITERQIQGTMRKLFQGRTSIIIAHRLSTVVACDKILMLKNGRLIGAGNHQELLHICEPYRNLCAKQQI